MKFGGHSALLLAVLSIVSRHKPIRAAFPADVLSRMDTTVDPCDDFQKYSCGTWTKSAVIAPDQTRVDASYQILYADADAAVEQIVQEKLPYIGEFWSSCMNTEQLDKLGASPLEPFLGKIIGAKDVAGVLVLGGQQRRNGNSFITDFDVSNDQKNGSLNTLWVGAANLVLPDTSFYTDKPTFQGIEQAYRTYITTVMKLAGFGPGGKFQVYPSASKSTTQQQKLSAVNLTTIADKIIALEQTLAPWVPDTSNSANWTLLYNPISVADALRKYPVGFGKYAQGIGLFEKSTLKPTSMVAFNSFEYAANVEKWLGNVDVVDLKLYLAFCYINANVQYLSSAFFDAYFQLFGAAINGETAASPRKSTCVGSERKLLPDLIGNYYFQKKFDQKREDETKLMVKLIEDTMADHISKLTWLDDATRAAALTKLSKVVNLIGHSTENISYPFQFKNDAYFANVHELTNFGVDTSLKQAGLPINRLHWSMSAAEANAYYWHAENEIVFPAAVLQPPFFNGTNHPAQNFGGIGCIIGHELTHGFDSSGRLYDGDGNMVNWWDPNTTAEFNKRAQCYIDEYNAFIMYGADGKALGHVNGTNTLGENIADNGGLSLSWDAYKQYMKTTSNMPTNGVLPEEADKLFFISNAQEWCMKYRDEAMLQQLASNVHSPYLARANGVVMNSEPFATTFQCKAGSKMNPTTKCVLW